MNRTITAYFDNATQAQDAAERLRAEGILASDIDMVAAPAASQSKTATTTALAENQGFLEALSNLFMPDEDRYAYQEGIRRGGTVLTVTTSDDHFERVSDILEDAGSVDLEARESEWKSEGWSGYDVDRTASPGGAPVAATRAAMDRTPSAVDSDQDATIEVVEETLRVGKRDVSHGRVRIRSYVVEDAVSEDVTLRSERVEIERRPVDRAVSGDDAIFRDQTIELEESAEEAIVSKSARVTEEIDLSRFAETRTETISDTVRRTEVEIDDERTGGRASAGTTSERILTDDERERARRDI